MACTFLLRDTMLPGSSSGGTWEKVGYSETSAGPYGAGGSDIPLGGDNPLIDPTDMIAGFYQLRYTNSCNEQTDVYLQIIAGVNAGEGGTGTYCINDSTVVNLADLLTGEDTGGDWTVSPNSDSVPSGAFDATAGTLDITLLGGQAGTYKFNYEVNAQDTAEYELLSCPACDDIQEVTVIVNDAFDAGDDNTILISMSNGSFNLFDFLLGLPDSGGTWTQVEGNTAPITGGYLGTVNLDSIAGCHFKFRYAGGSGNCADESFVTVNKDPDFHLTISRSGNTLTANHDPCSGITYKWYKNTGTGYVDTGLTTKTITVTQNATYKVQINCNGCIQEKEYVYELICDNNPCFTFSYDESTDCLTLTKNGTNNSPIDVDQFLWKKDGGSYSTYSGPICGCNLREYLDVTPYCSINGSKIRVGYSGFSACSGRIINSLSWEYGDGSTGSASGSLSSYWLEYTPADWIKFGRSVTFSIRSNTPIGTLIKKVKFTYSGSNQVNCSYISIVEENDPKLYYKIWGKREVSYTDGCPTITCENYYQKDNGCALSVNLSNCNVGGASCVCATYYNCPGNSPTYQWKRNGSVLSGETQFYCPKSYGYGVYECIVTCGSCTASDTLIYQEPCDAGVSISVSGSVLTANVSGCSGSVTYQWYLNGYAISGATSSTYTATQSGTYKVIINCDGCTAEATKYFELPCTIDVTISRSGNTLTANVTGCSGYGITYKWERFDGTNWIQVGTSSTYTPTQNGTYRVTATCNGCSDTAQIGFNLDCNIDVTISVSGGGASETLTANVTGCGVNPITYKWYKWDPGTNAWILQGTNQILVVTDPALYKVVASCGGCDDEAIHEFTGCSVTVSISISGNQLTANPSGCSGSVTYLWQLSVNGGSTWTNVGTTQTITASQSGIYRVTITCDGCTATDQETYTEPCNTTLNLSYNSTTHVITATTSGCSGTETILWQYSATGSGWTDITSGVYSITATTSGYYRAITHCDGGCPLSKDIHVVIDNPCDGVTMVVNASPGKLSWDVLKLSGVPVTNYLISWRRVSDNVEMFQSAAGSYYNSSDTYPHPRNGVPIAADTYVPYILNSDLGDNLDCLPHVTVPAVNCNTGYSLSYNGAGGIRASETITMNVDSGTGHIKIGINTQTVADKIQVKYNGSTIFDSGNISTGTHWKLYVVPITYVSGVNTADIIITNSTPSENTIWSIKLACCTTKTSCPITLPIVTMNVSQNSNCGCDFKPNRTYDNWDDIWDDFCLQVNDYPNEQFYVVGGCGTTEIDSYSTCVSCDSITLQKTSGSAGFILTFPSSCQSRYETLRDQVNACTANQWISLVLKTTVCTSDGTSITVEFFPDRGTVTMTDATRTIEYTCGSTNPFPNSCTGCDVKRYNTYQSAYNKLNNASSPIFTNSPYKSILRSAITDALALAVNPFTFTDWIDTECGLVERKYKVTFRDNFCPCISWQMFEDTNNDGTYETLRTQGSYSGSCA